MLESLKSKLETIQIMAEVEQIVFRVAISKD